MQVESAITLVYIGRLATPGLWWSQSDQGLLSRKIGNDDVDNQSREEIYRPHDDGDDDDDDDDDDIMMMWTIKAGKRYIVHLVSTQLKLQQIRPWGPLWAAGFEIREMMQ